MLFRSCKAVFILLCHCVKEHAGRWCLSPAKAAAAAQARPGGCLMRGCTWRWYKRRVVCRFEMFLSFWADRPSKGVLVGTAPLDCVEIPSVAVVPGGRIWFRSVVLFDFPLPCFMFQKAVVARSPSWTLQPLKESVPSSESLCQEPEALRSHMLWEHRCPQLGLTCLYTLLAFCLFA